MRFIAAPIGPQEGPARPEKPVEAPRGFTARERALQRILYASEEPTNPGAAEATRRKPWGQGGRDKKHGRVAKSRAQICFSLRALLALLALARTGCACLCGRGAR
eukprot:7601551-Pyramimonas_sp.AAC.1